MLRLRLYQEFLDQMPLSKARDKVRKREERARDRLEV